MAQRELEEIKRIEKETEEKYYPPPPIEEYTYQKVSQYNNTAL